MKVWPGVVDGHRFSIWMVYKLIKRAKRCRNGKNNARIRLLTILMIMI